LNRTSVAAGRTAIGQHSRWFGSVRPLNVLVLLAESGVLSFPSGASPHCVLVCPNPEGAGAALQTFEPDVVLFEAIPAVVTPLLGVVTGLGRGRRPLMIALGPIDGPPPSGRPGFDYAVPLPASSGEFDQLLRQISCERTADRN